MASNEAAVKGMLFKNTLAWLIEDKGQDGFERFISELPRQQQVIWQQNGFSPIVWYSADFYRNLYQAVMSVWGKDDPSVFRQGAGQVAYRDLSTIIRAFMKIGTPSFIASRFNLIWRHYFNRGMVMIKERDKNRLKMEVISAQEYGSAGCEGTIGWTAMALEYAGAKELRVNHTTCCLKGHHSCLFP